MPDIISPLHQALADAITFARTHGVGALQRRTLPANDEALQPARSWGKAPNMIRRVCSSRANPLSVPHAV